MAVTRAFVDDLSDKLGIVVTQLENGTVRLRGTVDQLSRFSRVTMARGTLYPTIIERETIDGEPTGEAPRIDIHPQAIQRHPFAEDR